MISPAKRVEDTAVVSAPEATAPFGNWGDRATAVATAGRTPLSRTRTHRALLGVPNAAKDRRRWVPGVAQIPTLHHSALDLSIGTPQCISCALVNATFLNESLHLLLNSSRRGMAPCPWRRLTTVSGTCTSIATSTWPRSLATSTPFVEAAAAHHSSSVSTRIIMNVVGRPTHAPTTVRL